MANIRNGSAVTLAKVMKFCRTNTADENDVLKEILDCVKDEADSYCARDFVDADGNDIEIPPHVELWVRQRVAQVWECRPANVTQQQIVGQGAITWAPKPDVTGLDAAWKPRF